MEKERERENARGEIADESVESSVTDVDWADEAGMFPLGDYEAEYAHKRARQQRQREGKQQLLDAIGRNERRFMYGAMGAGELQALRDENPVRPQGPGYVTIGGFKMPKKLTAPPRATSATSRSDAAFVGGSAAVAAMDQTERTRPTMEIVAGGRGGGGTQRQRPRSAVLPRTRHQESPAPV